MKFDQFLQELSSGRLRQVYYFVGEEQLLAEEGARAIVEAVLPGSQRDFGLIELGPESDGTQLRQALLSPPIFGAKRVVHLSDAGSLTTEARKTLFDILSKLPPETLLIAHSIRGGDKGKTKPPEQATVVECVRQTNYSAAKWAVSRAASLGLSLDNEAVRFLVETTGTDLRRIALELEKARDYLGQERDKLTIEDLRALLGRDMEDNIFQLAEKAASGRIEDALSLFHDLMVLGQPEALLLTLLTRQVRQILIARHLRDRGEGAGAVADALKVKPFVGEKLHRQAARFTVRRCEELLERMLQADIRCKTGERDPRIELELVILALAGK